MRIAITTRQPGPGGPLDCATDSRFGRSDGFVVADTETGEARYVENAQGAAHARGAGILAAQAVVDRRVDAVLTGQVGDKAFLILAGRGVRIFYGAWPSARHALDAFRQGALRPAAWPGRGARKPSESKPPGLRAV